jgi:hypothetical protein
MDVESINLCLTNLPELPANNRPENRLHQKNNPCTEKMTPVRKKNHREQKILLLPEKLTPVPKKKSQFPGKKSPGNENFQPAPVKKRSAPKKNPREAKKDTPVQIRKRVVPKKNSLYPKKVVCTQKKSLGKENYPRSPGNSHPHPKKNPWKIKK